MLPRQLVAGRAKRSTDPDDQKNDGASGIINAETRKYQDPLHSVVAELLVAEGRSRSPLFLTKRQNFLTAVQGVGRVSLPVQLSPLWVDSGQSPTVNIPARLNH